MKSAKTASRDSYTKKEYASFLERYPEYETTSVLDEIRDKDFSRLDAQGHIYLDYTGAGLYGDSQVRRHLEFLLGTVLGNPHSSNPISSQTTGLVERCRGRILSYFNASPDEYVPIFTANASHALKLVGESYPFSTGDIFLLSFDNHNSVNGIREFDRARGAVTKYLPVIPPDLRISEETLEEHLASGGGARNKLFAFPAQSNFSGVQYPLEWIEKARSRGWDVLIDAAAFVPTNRLDLGRFHPDYAAVSFYKMFGYPTGVGVLLARREALKKLRRPWFAGGTITVASVQADKYFLAPGAEGFEDGTLNFTSFPAIEFGLDFIDSIGIDIIHERVRCLTGYLLDNLLELRHGNGKPLIRLYGPTDTVMRGGTLAINVYDGSGKGIDHLDIEERANRWMISLRTGCFCNPGAREMALGFSKDELVGCLDLPGSRMTADEFRQCIDGKSTGAVRVSVGPVTNFADVSSFLRFIEGFME